VNVLQLRIFDTIHLSSLEDNFWIQDPFFLVSKNKNGKSTQGNE